MMKKLWKSKVNNSGAALVTVVIVIAFVSVLVTTVLYMAGMNYYAKGTDRMTKISFYDAEIGMERIKAMMMMQAKEAHIKAYRETMIQCGTQGPAERQKMYNEAFADAIIEQYAPIQSGGSTLEGWLEIIAQDPYSYGLELDSAVTNFDESQKAQGKIFIRGVKLSYNKDGYQTIIQTDFCIQAPDISWDIITNPASYPSLSGLSATEQAKELAKFERNEIDMSDCVVYYNWKKE